MNPHFMLVQALGQAPQEHDMGRAPPKPAGTLCQPSMDAPTVNT
jgi:hypothetical protein